MSEEEIIKLRAQLAGLKGPARTMPLLHLDKNCWERYWRLGMGSTLAMPYLEEGIKALEEAYGYLGPGDGLRGQTGVVLGSHLATRFSLHNGADRDGDRAIEMIEETIDLPGVVPVHAMLGRTMLGQAQLVRAMRRLQVTDFMASAMRTGVPADMTEDVNRAEANFQEVIDKATVVQLIESSRAMLRVVQAVQTLLSGFGRGIGGFDIGQMIQAMTAIQDLQRSGQGGFAPGTVLPPIQSLADFEWVTEFDPLDRPVTVLHDSQPDEPAESAAPKERPKLTVDIDAMRQALRELIGTEGGNLYERAVELLRSNSADTTSWIDEFVGLATSIVHSEGTATATDHFLLAVALYLRSHLDDDGWAGSEGDDTGGDARAATQSALAAAKTMVNEQPDGVPALVYLATLLPVEALAGVAEQLTDITKVLHAIGTAALVFPEPVASLRFNATSGRIEAASAGGTVRSVVVIGQDARRFPGGASAALDDDLILSHVASLSQLIELSRRQSRPVTEKPVFLANPRGDRETATMEAMLLRRSFYPQSTGLGRLVENADGTGTAAEVHAHLDASLLHLACGITPTGALELAGSAELALSDLKAPRGGLVILPPGHFLPHADTLLEAGFTGVIGWHQHVPDHAAALMMYILHAEMADNGRSPAAAVRAVRRWFSAPDVTMLPQLLAGHAGKLDDIEESDWASLVYRGR